MRNLTMLLLALPSFITSARAEDRTAAEDKYQNMAALMTCTRGCQTTALNQQSNGADPSCSNQKMASCKVDCNDTFNRVPKIMASTQTSQATTSQATAQ